MFIIQGVDKLISENVDTKENPVAVTLTAFVLLFLLFFELVRIKDLQRFGKFRGKMYATIIICILYFF